MSGIYVHIPFCKQSCHYCNFHFSTSVKYIDEMVDSICKEINRRSSYLDGEVLETIYFGGGTPSLLTEGHLAQIFEAIRRSFEVNVAAEITLEANPDDLTIEKLKILAESPINRLSIGVQSFHEAELIWMNRAHNAEESIASILQAQKAGFENISMDLIFGIPQSSHELWKENLRRTLELGIPHISMYALTVEDNTALGRWVQKGKEAEAEDKYVMEQFDIGIAFLEQAGYEQYEISNYALPGREAVHNSNYWKTRHYLGVGPSAHSFDGYSRSMNVANNVKYMKAIADGSTFTEIEVLDAETRYNEYVMTRLRTKWGIKIGDLGIYKEHFLKNVLVLIEKGWVKQQGETYTLTKQGKHFADAAAADLFAI